VGAKVNIKGSENVRAVPGRELDGQGVAIEGGGKGDDVVCIEFVYAGGDDRCHPRRVFA
jgi:hypothetical protein